MHLKEWIARFAFGFIVIGLPLTVFGYQFVLRPAQYPHQVVEIRSYAPEAGGFSPASIRVNVGEPVTLRFTSMDVTHGIAIGPGLDVDLGHIDPGEHGEVTLTFNQPGTFTYYCTTWCSKNHWRMRGVIEVRDAANPDWFPAPQPDPVIQRLMDEGINIDALHTGTNEHDMVNSLPAAPSVERGHVLASSSTIPAQLHTLDWQRTHTPLEAVSLLRQTNPALTKTGAADVVAYLWQSNITDDRDVQQLYNQNCAACHGETGNAEGPAAQWTVEDPPAFADLAYMFTMRSDVLYAKIRRGGMGTDMPNFGTLFTREETWALVDYLWQLGLDPAADE